MPRAAEALPAPPRVSRAVSCDSKLRSSSGSSRSVVVLVHGHAHAAVVGAPAGCPTRSRSGSTTPRASVGFRERRLRRSRGSSPRTSGAAVPAALRKGGAQTVYWHMKLGALVGTTTAPADPATITAAARSSSRGGRVDRLRDAVHRAERAERRLDDDAVDGDELALPPEHPRRCCARSRRRARGRSCSSTRSRTPAATRPAWWREAAQVADIVPEVYFNAPRGDAPGRDPRQPRGCGRRSGTRSPPTRRSGSRSRSSASCSASSPARARAAARGSSPPSTWFRVREALHARREAGRGRVRDRHGLDVGVGDVQHRRRRPRQAGGRVRLPLDARPVLCDGPAAAGTGFDDSRAEGQLETIPAGAQCTLDGRALRQTDLSRMTAVTRDRDVAFTILYDRLVETGLAKVVGRARDAGDPGDRRRRLRRQPAGVQRRAREGAGRTSSSRARRSPTSSCARRSRARSGARRRPSARSACFYGAYADVLIRPFKVTPAAPWLGNRRAGLRARRVGPGRALPAAVRGRLAVHHRPRLVHGHAAGRGAPARRRPARGRARPAIRTTLRSFARTQAYEDAARKRAESALNRTTCLRDDLPNPAVVSVSTYLPFLALSS